MNSHCVRFCILEIGRDDWVTDMIFGLLSGRSAAVSAQVDRISKWAYTSKENEWTYYDGSALAGHIWRHNITPILFGHALLYVFGQQYLIPTLQQIAIRRLCDYFITLDVFPLTRGPVLDLLQYVYNNDHIMERGETLKSSSFERSCGTSFRSTMQPSLTFLIIWAP
jgi:hypothetical protein